MATGFVDFGKLFDADAYWRAGHCPWTFFAYPTSLADEQGLPPDVDAKGLLADLQRRGLQVGIWTNGIAENAMQPVPGGSAGGVTPPGLLSAIQYLQGQMAAVNEHRISAGVGVRDVLPGLDFDLFAGGMFEASQQFGPFTSASVESYWLGAGMTWRFGRGACEHGDWSCP